MNFLKQNSDYALRIAVHLGRFYEQGQAINVKTLAHDEDVTEQFTAKILQKLAKADLAESVMGPKGGYRLKKSPTQISMLDVIVAMQGQICLNKCSPGIDTCNRKCKCPISKYVILLENDIVKKLSNIKLNDMIDENKGD